MYERVNLRTCDRGRKKNELPAETLSDEACEEVVAYLSSENDGNAETSGNPMEMGTAPASDATFETSGTSATEQLFEC